MPLFMCGSGLVRVVMLGADMPLTTAA